MSPNPILPLRLAARRPTPPTPRTTPTTITTWPSGTAVDLALPDLDMIDLRDIAHALALLPRYTGHTPTAYSVATHCLIGSHFVPAGLALEFLLHDAHEAYLGDVSTPLKRLLAEKYEPLAERFDALIAVKFGLRLDGEAQREVARVDALMLAAERFYLRGEAVAVAAADDPTQAFTQIGHLVKTQPAATPEDFLARAWKLMAARYMAAALAD